MAAKSAPILPPPTTAAVAVMMSLCVVAAASLLAVAAPPVSGDPVAGLPALMAARGGSSSGGRVGDSEPVEMDSEAHRRVVLALRGGGPPPVNIVLQSDKVWCEPPCTGKSGDPYLRGCKKIYHCPGATSANEFAY